LGGETYARELFEEYIVRLKERFKEKERMREEEKVLLVCFVESFTISPINCFVLVMLFVIYGKPVFFRTPTCLVGDAK
jgi:hypothetical protein